VADGVRLRAGAELGGVGAGGMASEQKVNFDCEPLARGFRNRP
jgi:hypothetical protein